LDAGRGIAVMFVVLQHTMERCQTFSRFSFEYFNLGEIGVVTFFLVSGFIIPGSIERNGSQRLFWVGRAFRLLPAYWCNFAVVSAVVLSTGILSPTAYMHPFRYLTGNLAMTQELMHVPPALGAYWTLQYELLFYILTSLLFAIGVLGRSALSACLAGLLFLFGNLSGAAVFHRALPAEKVGIVVTAFIGTLIYRYSRGAQPLRSIWLAVSIMAVACVVANWLKAVPNSPLSDDLSFLLGYLLFGQLFLLRTRKFPAVLLWLGKISYSVYLWHGFVLRFIPVSIPVGWQLVIVLVATLPLALLSFHFIEVPAQGLHKRISASWRSLAREAA
jgi:peptidoglycan/LPS O-acetylase OafA/YrhL